MQNLNIGKQFTTETFGKSDRKLPVRHQQFDDMTTDFEFQLTFECFYSRHLHWEVNYSRKQSSLSYETIATRISLGIIRDSETAKKCVYCCESTCYMTHGLIFHSSLDILSIRVPFSMLNYNIKHIS